jgi:hypothetical protein
MCGHGPNYFFRPSIKIVAQDWKSAEKIYCFAFKNAIVYEQCCRQLNSKEFSKEKHGVTSLFVALFYC